MLGKKKKKNFYLIRKIDPNMSDWLELLPLLLKVKKPNMIVLLSRKSHFFLKIFSLYIKNLKYILYNTIIFSFSFILILLGQKLFYHESIQYETALKEYWYVIMFILSYMVNSKEITSSPLFFHSQNFWDSYN